MIGVLIVTFNRLELLKKCIEAVRSQTIKPDSILVVNNGSTDNTINWLNEQKDVIVITQENLGSGGGQYSGIKYFHENGYKWVWCMDDDGLPLNNTLEELIKSKGFNEKCILGSLVIDPNSLEKKLSFHLPILKSYNKFLDYYLKLTDDVEYVKNNANEYGFPWGAFFNSVLIPTEAIQIAGYPKKELFIWGDEVEYFMRLKKMYKRMYLVPKSVFFHPKPIAGKIAKWKEMYLYRNKIYIHKKYSKTFFIRICWILVMPIFKSKIYLYKPILHGIFGIYKNNYHLISKNK